MYDLVWQELSDDDTDRCVRSFSIAVPRCDQLHAGNLVKALRSSARQGEETEVQDTRLDHPSL
jgi:hypothetical protein